MATPGSGISIAQIVILGGGFAGVACARELRRELDPNQAEITLFNEENHLVFSPLLADAVGASLNPLDVVVPLRQLLPGVNCRTQEIVRIDLQGKRVVGKGHGSPDTELAFDHLVIASGQVANMNAVPGMADHAFPLKTVADASVLRAHVLEQLELAEITQDPERKRWHLSFVVVGGGYSGVEAAGEINDLVRSSLRFFRHVRREDVRVSLIHSRGQLLPEIGDALRDFARVKMEGAGVEVLLNARVQMATPEGVGLADGNFIRGATTVCTVGSMPAPILAKLEVGKDKGRLRVEPDLRVQGRNDLWAIGDCATIPNAFDGQPCPPTGQFAERQGKQAAANIARVLRGEPTRPFSFKPLGQLCSIGGHSAVAEVFGCRLSGFLAWFVWRGVYLFKLPSWSRRFKVGFDWAWLLVFARDLSHLKARTTDRVSHAHFEPGDFIVRQGDASANFYVIEKGEVEILKESGSPPKSDMIAVLGPGSFFGEQALVNNSPRIASVRARTAVEVVVMGRNVFDQVSKTLAPLRVAIAQALNRRSQDAWKDQPLAQEIMKRTEVNAILDPAPQPFLAPTATLLEVSEAFVESGNDCFLVSSDGMNLAGIVTMTDLMRAHSTPSDGLQTLGEFMTAQPVALCLGDSCEAAASTFREHKLKTLPVVEKGTRKLAGCVRARRLMAYVLREMRKSRP